MLLDTNVILDYLSASRPCHGDAVDLLQHIFEMPGGSALVPISSLKDAYCILCKVYGDESLVRSRLADFTDVVDLVELTASVVHAAFASDEPDFEDAIVRAMAEMSGAEAIITRDAAAFASSPIPSLSARGYLELTTSV